MSGFPDGGGVPTAVSGGTRHVRPVFDALDQEMLALAWERIRTYRVDRRPRSVAANILLDNRKADDRGVLESEQGRLDHRLAPRGRDVFDDKVEMELL